MSLKPPWKTGSADPETIMVPAPSLVSENVVAPVPLMTFSPNVPPTTVRVRADPPNTNVPEWMSVLFPVP